MMLRLAEKAGRILAWDDCLGLGGLGCTQSCSWDWQGVGQSGLGFSAHDLSRLNCWWSHGFKCRKRKQNPHASISQSFFNVLASYLLMFYRRKQANGQAAIKVH